MRLALFSWLSWSYLFCVISAMDDSYSSIVLFGASYCDNGHPRPKEYPLMPPPYYGGRHSNGIVFSEYMARQLGVNLFDYAYSGATVDNAITPSYVPDTKSQVANYTSQVSSGSIDRGNGRVLHMWWIGINIITAVWDKATQSPELYDQTLKELSRDVDALVKQAVSIATNKAVNSQPVDILVLTIPPFELIPMITDESNGDTSKFEIASKLSARYNELIVQKVTRASRQLGMIDTFRSYDIKDFWSDMHDHPPKYGFSNVDGYCLHDSNEVCNNPDQYMYWDSLHPTTATHRHLSDKLLDVIR